MKGCEFNVDAGDCTRVRVLSDTQDTCSLLLSSGPSTCELDVALVVGAVLMPRSQNFNEVMPAIYARFMEKEARQWRQIYKASHRFIAILFETEEA